MSCAFLRGLSLDQMHLFENPLRQDVLAASGLLRTSIRPSLSDEVVDLLP
jgi:hypothetical protein